MISRVIYDIADAVEEHSEVKSSEEMRAAFEKYNAEVSEEDRQKSKIFSFDIKSLYPSMKVKVSKESVKKLILKSKLKLESVNTWELVKYIAIVSTKEEIEELSLENVVPKRETNRGRKPTINYLSIK